MMNANTEYFVHGARDCFSTFCCSLNRRLEALSTTKFGSQDSGLNRIGLTVPNTNQHAVEGSNPVWGNDEAASADFDGMR
jgi:hypothetical protein